MRGRADSRHCRHCAVVQDPQRGEKSNFLSHTKTSNKQKGTLARKITMRKGSNVRFFVLDADSLAYFNDVDGKELGRMSVADIQHVHSELPVTGPSSAPRGLI